MFSFLCRCFESLLRSALRAVVNQVKLDVWDVLVVKEFRDEVSTTGCPRVAPSLHAPNPVDTECF